MLCACAILSPVTCLAIQSFSTLSRLQRDFRKKVIEHELWVLIFSASFISDFKKNLRRYHKCTSVWVWNTRYSCQVWMKLVLLQQIFKKIISIRYCSVWTDRHTSWSYQSVFTILWTHRSFVVFPPIVYINKIKCCKAPSSTTILLKLLTHCGPETSFLVFGGFSLQLWKTDDANLPFNTRVDFTHLITQ
jgi:hypothetical protein